MKQEPSPVAVRLSDDALHLEVLLAPAAVLPPAHVLAALIRERSAQLNVDFPLQPRDLELRLKSCRRGVWMTLLSGTPPTPPRDGRVELLVPIPVLPTRQAGEPPAGGQLRLRGMRQAVRAGTVLARAQRGLPGSPGFDLLGRAIVPRAPRAARLPRGENTDLSADETKLLAACDGEVVLRHLHIHVVPMHVHDGDLTGSLTSGTGVFVTGSARAARITAQGEVYIQGDADDVQIESSGAGICVGGRVSGTPRRPSVLEACTDITCGSVLHADLRAGSAIALYTEARHSSLAATGNLYVQRSIEHSLLDVHLRMGGGVVPVLTAPEPLVPVSADRKHFRVPTQLPAALAPHGTATLAFHPCTILDLSVGGARCAWSGGEVSRGVIMQLKVELPDHSDQILIIARVSRVMSVGMIALAFLQMTAEDQHRLTAYCLQRLLARKNSRMASRADRARRE